MLISKEVEVVLNSTAIKYYENLGYEIPRYYNKDNRKMMVKKDTRIKVKIKDLPLQSNLLVTLKCDYCGKEYPSRYQDYYHYNTKGNIHKDACGDCSHLKSAEANLLLYGVDNAQKRPEVRKKFQDTCLEKYGEESFLKSKDFERGIKETHWNWKGGITPDSKLIRNSNDYKQWRDCVFARDNYTCQCCGKAGGKLQAHHLENFADNIDLRFDIDNGITLCFECHSPIVKGSFHNLYGSKNNNSEQFKEFILNYKYNYTDNTLKNKETITL